MAEWQHCLDNTFAISDICLQYKLLTGTIKYSKRNQASSYGVVQKKFCQIIDKNVVNIKESKFYDVCNRFQQNK